MAQSGEVKGDLAGEIIVRRARLSDYEAIVNMMKAYEGFDYFPTMFHSFMHSKKNATLVVERIKDRKLLSVANFRVSADGRTVYPMYARVIPEYEGHGLTRLMRNKFAEDHPAIERSMFDGVWRPANERLFKTGNISRRYHWNMLAYVTNNASLLSWSAKRQPISSSANEQTVEIRAVNVNETLTENVRKFLRRYSDSLAGTQPWRTAFLDDDQDGWLREQLLSTNVLVTSGGAGKSATTDSSKRNPVSESPLVAVSFMYPYLLKTPQYDGHVMAHLFAYCDDLSLLTDHVAAQLRHLANVVENNVIVAIHFPLSIDVESVRKCFAAGEDRWPKGMEKALMHRPYYLACVDLPKSML